MGDKRDPQNKNEIYARSVRCPVHHAVIGKYDVRDGNGAHARTGGNTRRLRRTHPRGVVVRVFNLTAL